MRSQSSRQKSGSIVPREHVVQLLRDGSLLALPAPDVLATADHLRALGVIQTEEWVYVKCANHEDEDFSPPNRYCPGRVYLDERLHDSGGGLRCPECDRPVFPDQYSKRRFSELRVHVLREGVMAHVMGLLSELDAEVREITPGILRLNLGDDAVDVCVVDFCQDEKYIARDRAAVYPTCYLAVNARDFEARFLQEDWVHRALLADVICGATNLNDVVRSAAQHGTPTDIRHASIPVCDKRPLPVVIEPIRPSLGVRRFVVEVGENTVRVEGVKVIAEQAEPRFIIFRSLWERFLEGLRGGLPPADFAAIPVDQLMAELETQTGKDYPDETTVRRTINYLQADIEKRLKQTLGLPVDREDVVQTCKWSGQNDSSFGYRINPFTVAVRPFQRDLSQPS